MRSLARTWLALVAAPAWVTWALAATGTYEAPLDVREAGAVTFTSPPGVTSDGAQVRIRFAVSAPADVEVAVLDPSNRRIAMIAFAWQAEATCTIEEGTAIP